MWTKDEVLRRVEAKELKSEALDGRDFSRLADFFEVDDWAKFGLSLVPCTKHDDCKADKALGVACSEKRIRAEFAPKPWTREAIVDQMRDDVAFGFEKARDERGISAGLMHIVVCMWLDVLEDHETDRSYPSYGLPTFEAVAEKYGFPRG